MWTKTMTVPAWDVSKFPLKSWEIITPLKFNAEPENDGFQVRNLLFQVFSGSHGLFFRGETEFVGWIAIVGAHVESCESLELAFQSQCGCRSFRIPAYWSQKALSLSISICVYVIIIHNMILYLMCSTFMYCIYVCTLFWCYVIVLHDKRSRSRWSFQHRFNSALTCSPEDVKPALP